MVSKKVRRGDDEEKKSQAENDTEASRPTTSAVTPECEGSPHPSWRTEPRAQRAAWQRHALTTTPTPEGGGGKRVRWQTLITGRPESIH